MPFYDSASEQKLVILMKCKIKPFSILTSGECVHILWHACENASMDM